MGRGSSLQSPFLSAPWRPVGMNTGTAAEARFHDQFQRVTGMPYAGRRLLPWEDYVHFLDEDQVTTKTVQQLYTLWQEAEQDQRGRQRQRAHQPVVPTS